jgi:hypothetical protein
MARPHLTRIGWTFRRAMAAWGLRVRSGLSCRWRHLARYLPRDRPPVSQPAVFVPLGGTGMAEASVTVVAEAPPRVVGEAAEAIIREARKALLDGSTLAPLEDVVLHGAGVRAIVANRAGESYVVIARPATRT